MAFISRDNKERIIIFDGVCIFCNKSLDMLIRLDKEKIFKYTSLQGEYVKTLDIPEGLDSIIFYEGGILYYKSTAILKIFRSLGGVWSMVNVLYIIPVGIRDYLYDMIAKYRYKFFGKMALCCVPTEDEKALFIP